MFLAVTTQAAGIRILPRHGFEADNLAYVTAALYVRRARAVAGLATMPVLQSGFEVRSTLELVCVQFLVAGLAGIAPHIFC